MFICQDFLCHFLLSRLRRFRATLAFSSYTPHTYYKIDYNSLKNAIQYTSWADCYTEQLSSTREILSNSQAQGKCWTTHNTEQLSSWRENWTTLKHKGNIEQLTREILSNSQVQWNLLTGIGANTGICGRKRRLLRDVLANLWGVREAMRSCLCVCVCLLFCLSTHLFVWWIVCLKVCSCY